MGGFSRSSIAFDAFQPFQHYKDRNVSFRLDPDFHHTRPRNQFNMESFYMTTVTPQKIDFGYRGSFKTRLRFFIWNNILNRSRHEKIRQKR